MSVLAWFFARPARIVGAGAVLAIGILFVRIHLLEQARDRAEARAREERLGRLNTEARADTTRILFEDSLAGRTRLAEQLRVESHARLRARDREAAARADLQVRFDSISRLTVSGPAAAVDTADVRAAELAVDSVPFRVRIRAEIPPPPSQGRWELSIALAPASMTLELACQGDKANAALVTPTWVEAHLERVQQTPDVCNRPARRPAGTSVALAAGLGLGVVWNGRVAAGPGGWIGVSLRF